MPNMLHGLKFNTHLSPVLMDFSEIKKKKKVNHQKSDTFGFDLQVLISIPVVGYLYSSILLNPEFPQDDVMHTAHWICPGVRFFMSARHQVRGGVKANWLLSGASNVHR